MKDNVIDGRKNFMKFVLALLTVLSMAILLTAAAGVPAAVHYIGHDQVSATMTKGGAIVEDPGLDFGESPGSGRG